MTIRTGDNVPSSPTYNRTLGVGVLRTQAIVLCCIRCDEASLSFVHALCSFTVLEACLRHHVAPRPEIARTGSVMAIAVSSSLSSAYQSVSCTARSFVLSCLGYISFDVMSQRFTVCAFPHRVMVQMEEGELLSANRKQIYIFLPHLGYSYLGPRASTPRVWFVFLSSCGRASIAAQYVQPTKREVSKVQSTSVVIQTVKTAITKNLKHP